MKDFLMVNLSLMIEYSKDKKEKDLLMRVIKLISIYEEEIK